MIAQILKEALQAGATDVHLAVGTYPFMRVGGKLSAFGYEKISSDVTLDFVLLYLSEKDRELFEEQGTFFFGLDLEDVGRVRVAAYRQLGDVALAIRFQKTREQLDAVNLQLPEAVWKLGEKEQGLILVTGSAGSGKTTTLAALLNKMNEERVLHIVTLEHPVEYVHPHRQSLMTQRDVSAADAAEAIAAAVASDADVIALGPARTPGVTEAALDAAESGILVLMEVNAAGPMGALEQLIDGFEPNRQKRIRERLLSVLEAIVFQQWQMAEDGSRQLICKVVSSKNK